MRLPVICAILAATLTAGPATAAERIDQGPLARLLGAWTIHGTIRGQPTATAAEVTSRFGGAFLELHIQDPAGRSPYEAAVFLGETATGEVVAHWLDATGADSANTLGKGRLGADRVTLVFPYPDGMMRNTLTYDSTADRWRMLIETGPADHPSIFADWTFDRPPTAGGH